jgi:hypothetical protein
MCTQSSSNNNSTPLCIARVELSGGNYTLVLEGGEEGDDGNVHYVAIDQDLNQSSKEIKASLVTKESPRALT